MKSRTIPLCLTLALIIPPCAVLLAMLAGRLFGDSSKEFGQLAIAAPVYLSGVLASWSLAIRGCLRGERPRILALAAVALGIAPLYWVH